MNELTQDEKDFVLHLLNGALSTSGITAPFIVAIIEKIQQGDGLQDYTELMAKIRQELGAN